MRCACNSLAPVSSSARLVGTVDGAVTFVLIHEQALPSTILKKKRRVTRHGAVEERRMPGSRLRCGIYIVSNNDLRNKDKQEPINRSLYLH